VIDSPAFPSSLPGPSPLPLCLDRCSLLGSHLRPVYDAVMKWAFYLASEIRRRRWGIGGELTWGSFEDYAEELCNDWVSPS